MYAGSSERVRKTTRRRIREEKNRRKGEGDYAESQHSVLHLNSEELSSIDAQDIIK
jgi:hypothetical protein